MAAKGKIVNTTNLRAFKRRGRVFWGRGTYTSGRQKANKAQVRFARQGRIDSAYNEFRAEAVKRGDVPVLHELDLWKLFALNGPRRRLRDRTLQRWAKETHQS